jgi:cyclomaltodextrinase
MTDKPAEGGVTLKPGRYRHFKGAEYAVQGVATHSESGEQLVVYTPLYGEGERWVRPLSMFLETVDRDGERMPRFTYIGK